MFEHSLHKPHGVVIVSSPDGRVAENDTQQCVHCGGHWVVVKGSGRPHVWCGRCGGNTCSQPRCIQHCYPIQARFDDIERHGREIWPT